MNKIKAEAEPDFLQNKEESVSRNSVLSLAVLVEKCLKQKCLFIGEGRQPTQMWQSCCTNGPTSVRGGSEGGAGALPSWLHLHVGLVGGSSAPARARGKKQVSSRSIERVRLPLGKIYLGSTRRPQTLPFFFLIHFGILYSLTLCSETYPLSTAGPEGPTGELPYG